MADGRESGTGSSGARPPGVGAFAALEGVALIVWNLVTTPIIGRRRLRWGTVGTEATDWLPGDELVPEPKWSQTLGVTVDAAPEAVWPWIAQIGQDRGGFYTYQTLENLAGCKITNTTEILPDHQHPAVLEAAVFGIPDERWGETPVAAVRLEADAAATPAELRDWINERVAARYQKVSEVVVRAAFPLSVAGKTLRRVIRDEYRGG